MGTVLLAAMESAKEAPRYSLEGWQALGVVVAFFVLVGLLTALSFVGDFRRSRK